MTEDLWARAGENAGTRIVFFNHLRSITVFLVFASWRDLIATLTFEQPRQGRRTQNAEMRTAASEPLHSP
jgi:hypothetical protein